MTESLTDRQAGSSRSCSRSSWWLLARHGDSHTEVLTLTCNGYETLPVFGFKEEAEMYQQIETLDDDWQISKTSADELLSVLSRPYASVRSVAIDPYPSALSYEAAEPVGIDPERFVIRVMRGEA
jgi:hypothetical protein